MPENGSEPKNESLPGKGWLAPLLLAVIVPFWEKSKFFEEDGWWYTATGLEQGLFIAWFLLAFLVTFLVFAAVAAIFSERWRQRFWKRFPLRVVRTKAYNELKARPKPTSRPGMRVYVPGVKKYGELETHEDMRTKTLRVQWINGTVIGELRPTNRNAYKVIYGRQSDSGFNREFLLEKDLGRAATPSEGVEMLRLRDLQDTENAERD
ncbi:hypothetical protein [Arthrobacter koreensis]|uniref:hypothetical protein n=1 Tax=Arthrobacter koreensis TaxID=199136 RepID=UPI003801A715